MPYIAGKRPYCKYCKTGKARVDNYLAMKAKDIPRSEYTRQAKHMANICTACVRNGIIGKTGWALGKLSQTAELTKMPFQFKTVDNFSLAEENEIAGNFPCNDGYDCRWCDRHASEGAGPCVSQLATGHRCVILECIQLRGIEMKCPECHKKMMEGSHYFWCMTNGCPVLKISKAEGEITYHVIL